MWGDGFWLKPTVSGQLTRLDEYNLHQLNSIESNQNYVILKRLVFDL